MGNFGDKLALWNFYISVVEIYRDSNDYQTRFCKLLNDTKPAKRITRHLFNKIYILEMIFHVNERVFAQLCCFFL